MSGQDNEHGASPKDTREEEGVVQAGRIHHRPYDQAQRNDAGELATNNTITTSLSRFFRTSLRVVHSLHVLQDLQKIVQRVGNVVH